MRDHLCDICGVGFKQKQNLERHKNGVHKFKCNECDLTFRYEGPLKQHENTVHGTERIVC